MTCIVGVAEGGKVWIGGDSALISGWDLEAVGSPKVFRVGEFLIGLSGSVRVSDLLRYAFQPPPAPDVVAVLHRYMVTGFVPALRETLAEGGVERKAEEVVKMDGSFFLVGVRGRLFEVHSDYQVSPKPRYAAAGCGWVSAMGALHALHATAPLGMGARERVAAALAAAEAHNIGVRGPMVIEVLGEEKGQTNG